MKGGELVLHLKNTINENDTSLIAAIESLLEAYKETKYTQDYIKIPLSIFSTYRYGILQAVVKYLKEEKNLTYSEIGRILNRDARTIWKTYFLVRNIEGPKLNKESDILVPSYIFKNRKLGPLEALVSYLREEGMLPLKEISYLLLRSYRNIWLSYKNSVIKRRENKKEAKNE